MKTLSLILIGTLVLTAMFGVPFTFATDTPAPGGDGGDGGNVTVVPGESDTTVIERTETVTSGFPIPMWMIIGFIALVVIILLVVIASRGRDI